MTEDNRTAAERTADALWAKLRPAFVDMFGSNDADDIVDRFVDDKAQIVIRKDSVHAELDYQALQEPETRTGQYL